MIRKRSKVLALVALIGPVAWPAMAIEFRGGQQVTIAAEEVITDDLYLTGESIIIDGVVQGDIVAVGRHIVLNGALLGDFIAAGQGIVVNGQVADDVRAAGFVLRLGDSAAVGDDVVGAAFSLEASSESLVGGGLVFSGFQALLAGEVRERILGQMGSLRIEGIVGDGGEVAVEGGQETPPFIQMIPTPVAVPMVPAGLTLGPAARVTGPLVYTSAHEAHAEEGSRATLTHVEVASVAADEVSLVNRSLRMAWRFVSVLVVGVVLLLAAPGWLRHRAEFITHRPLAAAGWGIAGLTGIPVLAMLLAVLTILLLVLLSLVKLPALSALVLGAALLGESSLALGVLAGIFLIAPAVMALWLGRTVGRSPALGGILAFGLGWLLLAALGLFPVLGGLVKLLVLVLGFGSLVAWASRPLLHSRR